MGEGRGDGRITARRAAGALAVVAALAGCPALVSDPPFRLVPGDAAAPDLEAAARDAEDADGGQAGDAGAALDAAGDGGEPTSDGGLDAEAAEAGCSGVICDGACLPGVRDCSGCPGKTSFCIADGTCQLGCGGCGSAISCLICPGGGSAADAAIGCGDGCLTGEYAHCACSIASDCVTANQTCLNSTCAVCGEPSTGNQHCYGSCSPKTHSETCVQSANACSCM